MAVAQGGNILRAIAKVIMLLFVARMVSILRMWLFLSQTVHSTWGVLGGIGVEVYWGREGGHRWCGRQKLRKNHKKELSEMLTGKDQAA